MFDTIANPKLRPGVPKSWIGVPTSNWTPWSDTANNIWPQFAFLTGYFCLPRRSTCILNCITQYGFSFLFGHLFASNLNPLFSSFTVSFRHRPFEFNKDYPGCARSSRVASLCLRSTTASYFRFWGLFLWKKILDGSFGCICLRIEALYLASFEKHPVTFISFP